MIPSIGRIVHYTLNESDANIINKGRGAVPTGDRTGNTTRRGDVYPMIITQVWSASPTEATAINGQVFLDGNDLHWVTSVQQGDGERHWRDPREVS